MKRVAKIPLDSIGKLSIVFGNGRSLQEIKAHTGADYVCNGGFYSGNSPVCHLKVDGETYAWADWMDWGYAWDSGPDLTFALLPVTNIRSYITALALIAPGLSSLSYRSEIGGRRARTAMGISNGSLVLYCCSSGDPLSREQLRKVMQDMGCTSALMLDGGGSSQCDFAGQKITSARRVNNYICIWKNPPKALGRYRVKAGTSVLNIRAAPSLTGRKVGAYKTGQIVEAFEIKGRWARTVDGWCHTNYLYREEA